MLSRRRRRVLDVGAAAGGVAQFGQARANACGQDVGRVIAHLDADAVRVDGGDAVQLLDVFDQLAQSACVGKRLQQLQFELNWGEEPCTASSGGGFNGWQRG